MILHFYLDIADINLFEIIMPNVCPSFLLGLYKSDDCDSVKPFDFLQFEGGDVPMC